MTCSADINQTHCLLHLSRESTNVFFALIFPTIRQGKGQSLSSLAQVKLVLCVHRSEGGNRRPAYQVHQTPALVRAQHLACGG